MSGVTNGYLEKIAKKFIGKSFLGVFPSDSHPNVSKKQNYSVIFNLSEHNEEGTHFVCLYYNGKILKFFDPLGDKLNNSNIKLFIEKNLKNNKIFCDLKYKIQSDESNFCSFYCLAFLLSQKLNQSTKKFFSLFNHNNLRKNDDVVIKFLTKNYK